MKMKCVFIIFLLFTSFCSSFFHYSLYSPPDSDAIVRVLSYSFGMTVHVMQHSILPKRWIRHIVCNCYLNFERYFTNLKVKLYIISLFHRNIIPFVSMLSQNSSIMNSGIVKVDRKTFFLKILLVFYK